MIDTQSSNQNQNRQTWPRQKIHSENVPPTGRLGLGKTPTQEIRKPTGRLASERRLIKKMSAQRQD